MAAALELRDMHAAYGRIEVLHGVDLVVPEASVFALLGPNGAGKTTTLKAIDGRLRPTRGCVHVAGTHVNGASTDALTRAGVCSIPEGRGIFPNLTVRENLMLGAFLRRDQQGIEKDLERGFALFPRLKEREKQMAGTLSGGEQQMLSIARALMSSPKLILLDELSMGLAPLIVAELYEVLAQLAADGVAILLVEQFARTALAIADYAAIMVQGRVQHVGQPADLADVVSEAYLGAGAA